MKIRNLLLGLFLVLVVLGQAGTALAANCVGGANDGNVCVAHSTCPGGFCAAVATPTATATPTVTPTPTVTATATATPPIPPRQEKHRERDVSTTARADTAAPRWLQLIADQGSVVDNGTIRTMAMNSFRIRGVAASIDVVGSECTLTLSVNGTTVLTQSLVGLARKTLYLPLPSLPDVPPGAPIILTTEVTGTNTGLNVQLDTIP